MLLEIQQDCRKCWLRLAWHLSISSDIYVVTIPAFSQIFLQETVPSLKEQNLPSTKQITEIP